MNNLFLRCYSCMVLFIFSAISFSQPFEGASFNNTAKQLLAGKDTEGIAPSDYEFLAVDEAYQLSVSIKGNEIIAEWLIADNYFLYGEKFKFSLKKENKTIPLKVSDPIGIIQYDEIFKKNVEKHYHDVRVVLDLSQFDQYQSTVLSITSQGCADAGLCYPPQVSHFTVDIDKNRVTQLLPPIEFTTSGIVAANTDAKTGLQMPALMILFALLGGVILNFMPCVFPILSIKALNIANNNTLNGSHKRHGWSYTLGIITAFVVFAISLLVARHSGQALGWGFQLQSPGFVTALIYLFWIMGMSLSGQIQLGTQIMGVGQKLTQGNSLRHSFFTGVLAVVVASPCTAPFMATALGYALTQSHVVALVIFISLGFGMALPLLLLCHLPGLEKCLPKPGRWMESLKQALAFPLYLTALWLLWLLGRQINSDAVSLVILGGIFIVFAHWVHQRRYILSRAIMIAVIIVVVSIVWTNSHTDTVDTQTAATNTLKDNTWQPYSKELLAELRQQGKPVFVNVTADWCITCLANEHLVLTEDMLSFMRDHRIHLIKADWTNYNLAITQLLQSYGRSGIPLYLLFPPGTDTKAKILPQILTPTMFRNEIEGIGSS